MTLTTNCSSPSSPESIFFNLPHPQAVGFRSPEREGKMSIAVGGRMERSGFVNGMQGCLDVYAAGSNREGYSTIPPEDRCGGVGNKLSDESSSGISSSSSSIGRDSGSGGRSCSSDGEEPEVQSSYKGPLDTMDSLEESLPVKKGISNFYIGKSKSFTSLSEAAAVTAAADLAKPEDPYNRKRKNLLLRGHVYEPTQDLGSGLRKSRSGLFGKKPVNPCRSRLPPLPPQGRPMCDGNRSSSDNDGSPPGWSFAPRSFSLMDLQKAR